MYFSFYNEISRKYYVFDTENDFNEWASGEVAFYDAFSPQVRRGPISAHLQLLGEVSERLRQSRGLDHFEEQLRQRYVPFRGFLDQMLTVNDHEDLKASLVSFVANPQAHNLQLPDQRFYPAFAALLARALRSFNNPEDLLNDVKQLTELQRSKIADAEELVNSIKKEWEEQKAIIDGIAANARLKAPKEYWKDKGDEKQSRLNDLKKGWLHSLGLILIVIGAFIDVSLAYPIASGVDIYQLVERAIIFGSLLSIAVWWSRQALRDYRFAEQIVEDAKERVAMIETFAALKGESLGGEGYQTILNAIFRSGINSAAEDGGPRLPIEILIKSLAEQAVKKPS